MSKYNPQFSSILPPLSKSEYESLKNSIRLNGIQVPILIDEFDNVIDGWHRLQIADELELDDIPITIKSGLSTLQKIQLAISLNKDRRQMSSSQLATLAVEVEVLLAKEAKGRHGRPTTRSSINEGNNSLVSTESDKGKARDQAANLFGTNGRYVQDSKKLKEEAPDLFDQVKNGKLTLPKAKKESRKRKRQTEIEEAIERLDSPPSTWNEQMELNTIQVCDICDLKLPPDSIDMIFTDPLYHDEYIHLYEDLARVAQESLKPGAYLMTYVGKMFLPDIMDILNKYLEYVSVFAVFHPFSKSKIQKHHLFENWRPILTYKKSGDSDTREWVQDVVRGERNKDHLEWQQDIQAPELYIPAYTKPLDIVLDPFVGSGTVPYVCKNTGRHFVAFDKNEKTVQLAKSRLNGTYIQES